MSSLINPNPIIYEVATTANPQPFADLDSPDYDESLSEAIDEEEIFQVKMIRHINDPEHPLTLEQLKVAQLNNITLNSTDNYVLINFTPTIPHCSMATLIGLCIRVKLLRCLPGRYKVDVRITPGTHSSEEAVNKQLNDKERVAAALENTHLLSVVNKCIGGTDM